VKLSFEVQGVGSQGPAGEHHSGGQMDMR
jgi:hypothetical protein